MPLGYFRRLSFISLVAYMAILYVLHRAGFFHPSISLQLKPCLGHFESKFEALALTPSKEGWGSWTFEAEIVGHDADQRALVRFPRNFPIQDVRPGEYLILDGKLELPLGPRNPGDFNARQFLNDRGIEFILSAFSIQQMSRSLHPLWIIQSWAAGLRKSIQVSFKNWLNPIERRLLSGMVLGLKGRLPKAINRPIQDAGVMHLLVPSGTKVVLVLAGIWALSFALALRPFVRVFLCVIFGGFYTLVVGGDPPYLRALFAALILELGIRLGRDAVPFQALVLSAWVALVLNPKSLFSMGFQMSYLATFGLIVAMPVFESMFPITWPPWTRVLARMGIATGIVEMLLWPIFSIGFGRAPFLGSLSNLILVPLAPFFMAGGFSLWILSRVHFLKSAFICAWGIKKGLLFFCWVCRLCSGLPFSAIGLSRWSKMDVVVYYLTVMSLLLLPKFKTSGVLALLAVFIGSSNFVFQRENCPLLQVIFLSVPHGNAAIVLKRWHRPFLVYDQASASIVAGVLRAKGISSLKKIIILGNESSAFRALESLLRGIAVSTVEVSNKSFALRLGRVAVSFSPPKLRRGEENFDIIKPLRDHAVEVATNGDWIQIKKEN